jgi:hypothetical protein
MKIIDLLIGIHAELKRLNENLEHYPSLNENAAIVADFNAKATRLRNNPLIGMTNTERELFKAWITSRLEARNLTPEKLAPDTYRRESIKNFIKDRSRCAGIEVRDTIAKGLGYQDFVSLYEDYKKLAAAASGQAKGGAA